MEMLETESVQKDSLTKSAKKKKGLDEQAIKNVRKISDFFKTPEKQVEKQKQKSLLQFFGKQDKEKDEKENDSIIASPDDVLVNGTDVTTPTSSDKENNEVVDHDITKNEKVESKSNSKKKHKNSDSGSEESNAGLHLKHIDNDTEVNGTKRHKKHKEKRKTKDEKSDTSLSDSVIMLSDSSSSNLPCGDSTEETTEEKSEVAITCKTLPKGKEVKRKSCHRIEKGMCEEVENEENVGEIEMETEVVEEDVISDNEDMKNEKHKLFSKDASDEKGTNERLHQGAEHKAQVTSGDDNIPEHINGKEPLSLNNFDKQEKYTKNKHDKQVTKVKKTKKRKTDHLDAVDKVTKVVGKEPVALDKVSKIEQSVPLNKSLENGKKKLKKSALKGKDMLNLLKEIQSGDSEDKNKRKHKKKHKHHKTKDKLNKEVLEIAVSEDNSDGKDEVKGSAIEKIKRSKTDSESSEEAGKRVTRRRSKVINDIKGSENEIDSTLTEACKSDIAEKPKQKGLRTNMKELDKDSIENISKQPPNQDILDTVDTTKEKEVKKEDDVKEMSYTEYLEMVEKSYVNEESVDLIETDNDNAPELQVSDEKKKDCVKINIDSEKMEDVVEQDFISEKNDVKNFFTFMTSTPDREKSNTKAGKIVGKRGRKPKSEKLKLSNKVKNDIDQKIELIEEKKIEIDSDIEVIDNKEETLSQFDGMKVSVSSKSLFTGKKTQATLSFGKAGLTVSKATTKSDEEMSKEKVSGTEIGDEVGKRNGNEEDGIKTAPRKRGRKPKQTTVALNISESSVFATPEKVERKAKRQLEDVESESGDSEGRRCSLRKRYKVEAFQMDADKKTPIKIKLKRCPKSSSSGEDIDKSALNLKKLKPTANQTTALALLEKAKRGRLKKHKIKKDKDDMNLKKHKEAKKLKKTTKKRNASNSSEDSLTRRSSRLEGRCMASMEEVSLENIVISSSDEEENIKVVRKRGRPKGSKNTKSEVPKQVVDIDLEDNKETPKKDVAKKKVGSPSKNRTPSKKAGSKLAPMFLMGKNKVAEPSPKKPPEDPELVRQRQQFLMSGVPEALRKQTATRIASQVDADYPPLPRTSHVLQVPEEVILSKVGGVNVWNLKPRELILRHFNVPLSINLRSRFTGDLITKDSEKPGFINRIVNFKPATPISDDMIELCKGEISSFNTAYPVTAMFKALKEMKIETERPPPKSESMLKTDMSGILDGCTDMTVIEDEDEDQGKKKRKKNLKLQKKDQKEEKVEKPTVEEKCKVTGSSMLWTEKYCPSKTAEVLGNSGVLKKLKTWLTEWKHVLDKEARKARKLLMKKNKGKKPLDKKSTNDLWDDDWDDFDMDSDDSDEDDSLCNTMLLSGPHGCGKTSSVYALALELGFKVHEVNASSCRSGKQILSQLQEATQSHQVSTQGNHTPRKNTALGDKPKPENKMPTAFTNLFKKSAPSDGDKQEEKQEKAAGRKRKRNKSDKESNPKIKEDKKGAELKHKSLQLVIEDTNSQSATKSLNLSSTTLILFDEVDVVFDEDKGFLSAIQSFMSKTKIPIILTSADPGFTNTFESRYEQLHFKRPSVASITSHLQTISLAENIRTDPLILSEMAKFYNCDMRRSLLTLQFLLKSGGGHVTSSKVIPPFKETMKNTNLLGLHSENSQSCLQSDSCETAQTENKLVIDESGKDLDNSDDDFVSIKPLRKRRRVLEDDNSNFVDTCDKAVIPVSTESTVMDSSEDAKNYPVVHSLGLESLISTNNMCIADMLSQGLKTNTGSALQEMICTYCCVKQISGSDLFYNNLHCILPFSTQMVDTVYKVSHDKGKTKKRQRIRMESDLYDSEASNEASKVEHDVETMEDDREHNETNVEVLKKGNKKEQMCLAKSLSYFTQFYDTMSSLDILESIDGSKICDKLQGLNSREVKGTLVAGMGNELAKFPTHCELDLKTSRDYCSEIGSRSMCKMFNECNRVKEDVEKLSIENEAFMDDFILPVSRQNEHFTLFDSTFISVPGEYKRACENTVDNLPLVSHSHLRTVHLDYLPTLREICRTEQCRQVTNTKRRFHHYLDSITLPLKDRTISTLATTFI